jgi:putative oxidoreductase
MKMATAILQRVLGFIFLAFGLNGFVQFIPQMPMPNMALEFFVGLAATHYMLPLLFMTQAISGALLLVGLFVPLALTLLAPVVLNILLFHVFLAPAGLPVAIIVVALELYLAWAYRDSFELMLRARPE